jgi:hypothetical protein
MKEGLCTAYRFEEEGNLKLIHPVESVVTGSTIGFNLNIGNVFNVQNACFPNALMDEWQRREWRQILENDLVEDV